MIGNGGQFALNEQDIDISYSPQTVFLMTSVSEWLGR